MDPFQARQLKNIQDALVSASLETAFIGGSIIPLLVDQAKGMDFRETLDFDVLVQVATAASYAWVEAALRESGFQHDVRPGAPICRWKFQKATVDVMPTQGSLLGLNTRWFSEAVAAAQWRTLSLDDNSRIKVVTPEYFIATKLEAFKDRGMGDYYASYDLEDIITVVDGVQNIADRIGKLPEDIRTYIRKEIGRYLADRLFVEALPGHLPVDAASQKRFTMLITRLGEIAA